MTNRNPPPLSHGLLLVIRVLCLAALAISGYLLYGSLTGERLPGCGMQSGCDTVLHTRWAYVFGVPVSLPALLLYLAVVFASWVPSGWADLLLTAAGAAFVTAALYFVGLQLFVIGAICKFCMTAHTCGFIAGALLLLRAVRMNKLGISQQVILAASAGVALVLLMGLGQGLGKEPTFAVDTSSGLAERKAPRILELHDGLFQLNLSEIPLHGSPEAPVVLVHLLDYTCPHCRELHPVLKRASQELGWQLAIASLLTPLATNCNHYMKRRIDAHTNACELAYTGLAVWRSDPARLAEFEDWIFGLPKPPLPAAARFEAIKLVGTNRFEAALKDPWLREHVARNLDLYATNFYRFKKSILPQLMIGTNIVSGNPRTVDDLYKVLSAQYSLKLPPSTNSVH
jgi:uncharacterized membrane protein